MNLRLTILNFCLLLLAASCSMEEDVLKDMENGHLENVEMGESSISFRVTLPSIGTKSLSNAGELAPLDEEAAINSCVLIVFENEKVHSIMEGLYVNSENYIVSKKGGSKEDWVKAIVKVKKPSPYSAMVVANSSTSFLACKTKSDIISTTQSDKDALVKVGTMAVDFPENFSGYSSIAEALDAPLTQTGAVTLHQLSARIELEEFNVKGFQGSSVAEKIIVTGVDVFNLNPVSITANEQTHKVPASYVEESKSCNVVVYQRSQSLPSSYSFESNKNLLSFYSFRNQAPQENDQIKMRVRFKVGDGGERTTKLFVINKDELGCHGVQSGYVYRLILNMTITGDEIRTDLKCYTNDWLSNEISIPMEEVD